MSKQGDKLPEVKQVLTEIYTMLVEKNEAYGDSIGSPVRIFSTGSPVEQILVRIDDKLSRIRSTGVTGGSGEDTLLDLIGYLVMLRAQNVQEKGNG